MIFAAWPSAWGREPSSRLACIRADVGIRAQDYKDMQLLKTKIARMTICKKALHHSNSTAHRSTKLLSLRNYTIFLANAFFFTKSDIFLISSANFFYQIIHRSSPFGDQTLILSALARNTHSLSLFPFAKAAVYQISFNIHQRPYMS